VRLEVFRHLLSSVADEMGRVLRRTAYSPNIKERRDFSCAVFDPDARMAAQAAHIPVHLGSMPLSVEACVDRLDLGEGDVAVLNDPYRGGTHLPDVTMVAPAFADGGRAGYVASRAHHADIGGAAPGSLPLARELLEEGLVIPPVKLVEAGETREGVREMILANVRTPEERAGDLRAQLASVARGRERLASLAERYGRARLERYMDELMAHAERAVRSMLEGIPDGVHRFRDVMEGDGRGGGPAEIVAAVRVAGDGAEVDFEGTAEQRESGINAVRAVTLSAVHYVVRALVREDVPSNAGCAAPVRVETPEGSLVDARPPAAVAGGNVETSQRIVDVLLGALAQACPDRVPAASQGTMNNVTVGARGRSGGAGPEPGFAYYETIAGGAGGRPGKAGADAVHSHMTNTLNTPVEALEFAYPLRVRRYAVRRGSGGDGRWPGGDGVVRETEMLVPARVTLLAERRRKEKQTGKKTPGRKPKPPEPGPRDKDQVNFTDPESRIMLTSQNGWQQAWNAQMAVDMNSHLIVAGHISQAPNDKQELKAALKALQALPEELGSPERITADNGYYSEDNITETTDRELVPYLATGRQEHNQRWEERLADPGPPPEEATDAEQMAWRLKTPDGKAFYGRRKATVETVFGIIKAVLGFRQFSLRGLAKVAGEWNLIKCAYNLKRMHALAQ
jgi:N-methylhydantoinase B